MRPNAVRWYSQWLSLAITICVSLVGHIDAAPPYHGTIFIDPDIVTPDEPTAFSELSYAGRGERTMYDRREGWVTRNAYLFDATFTDGLTAEIQVNPEFGSVKVAEAQAERFAPPIGQLPTALRADVETVWIHRGTEPFGGGNNNLLIHTGQADDYVNDGILEETLIHEAAHTSLDAQHARARGWRQAQRADAEFISTYARDNPFREDIAESFLPYLAIRHRRDRISDRTAATIESTIPNRIAYFDGLELDLFPMVPPVCETPSAPPIGDLNEDGMVGFADFLILSANYGDTHVGYQRGDIDCSGAVDFADFLALSANFGTNSPEAAEPNLAPVPEPHCLPLGLCILGLEVYRQLARGGK